jgi:cytoskeletal protein CcmA (bactofilin family)
MFNSGRGGDLNGFLDQGSRIEGDLHFEDTFRVEGHIHGRVVSKGQLVVGEHGRVEGEIAVDRVLVTGRLQGKIVARRVELARGCRVEAEIETPVLVIEEGAFFEGRCHMGPASAASETPGDTRGPRAVDEDEAQRLRRARKS